MALLGCAAPLQSALAQVPPVIQCQGRPVTQLAFSNPVQTNSGTTGPLAVGAQYRYSNIATGVDALVTVTGFANGGSLGVFDNDVPANTPSGPRLVNYFQPELVSVGNESAVDFRFDFVASGTSTPVALDLAASAIDVDGNGNPNGTLREFAEFESTAVGYVLDANTRLARTTTGTSAPDMVRYTPTTDQFAPGIDPTAEDVITTNFYTDTSSVKYRIGTVGTGSGTRLTSLGFDCPNLQTPAPQSTQDEDFGDAPLSYGNAIHTLDSNIRLGAALSADAGPYDSATATGDDDDGVTGVPDFLAGEQTSIDVSVTGAGGLLQAWVDWNRDGDFTDLDEQVAADLADTDADGTIALPIRAPLDAVAGVTFARLRWSTVAGVDHQEAADDGEVEDYALSIDTPTPFACDGQLYQIATNQSTLKRLNITQSGSGYTANLTNVAGIDFQVNAGWGFSEVDDVIYGVRSGTRELWRIDAQGRFTQLGTVTGANRNGSNAGDVLPDGRMLWKTGNSRWSLLDLTDPLAPTVIGDIPLSKNINNIDFGVNPQDGRIYGVNRSTSRLFYVDISGGIGVTAQVVEFGPASYSGAYGAAWFDERGNMYLYDNNSNGIFMIDVGTNGDGPALPVLLATSTNDEGGINDGAYCRGPAPVPLGSISGTLFEDDDGDDVFGSAEGTLPAGIDVSLYWDNGTPGDTSDDTLIKTATTDANGAVLFDNQVTVETYRLEVDVTDPDIPQDRAIGTTNPRLGITVAADAVTTGQDFGFDELLASLDAQKTVELWNPGSGGGTDAYFLPGNDVVYRFEVTNNGGQTVTDGSIFLLDTLPDEVELWNGDFEAGAPDSVPGTDTIAFVSSDASLQFDAATDFGVSYGATPPADFSQCQTLAQTGTYLPTVRHICLRVRGDFAPATPNSSFSWSLRTRLR